MIKPREYETVWTDAAAPLDLKRIAAELARAIAKDGARIARKKADKKTA